MNKLSSYIIFFVLLQLVLPWRAFAREVKKDSTKTKTHNITFGTSFGSGFSIQNKVMLWKYTDLFNAWGIQVNELDSAGLMESGMVRKPSQPFSLQGVAMLGYNYNNRFTIGFGLSYATFRQFFLWHSFSDIFQVLNFRLRVAHYPYKKGRIYVGYGISIDRSIRTSIEAYYGEKSYRQLSGEVCIKRSLDKKEKVWVTVKAGWAYHIFKNGGWPDVAYPNTFYRAYSMQKNHSLLISLGLKANIFSYAAKKDMEK